jgi:hypothetical protein
VGEKNDGEYGWQSKIVVRGWSLFGRNQFPLLLLLSFADQGVIIVSVCVSRLQYQGWASKVSVVLEITERRIQCAVCDRRCKALTQRAGLTLLNSMQVGRGRGTFSH